MTLPEILVLRHGQTDWNVAGRMQGWFDSPLTAQGHAQALAQGAILADQTLDGFDIISSPLGRAMQTAQIALPQSGTSCLVTDDRVREIDLGAWNGKTKTDIESEIGRKLGFLEVYDLAPGEGLQVFFERCQDFLYTLNRPSVVFTHGITSRVIRAIAMGRSPSDFDKMPGGQGVVYRVKDGVQKKL